MTTKMKAKSSTGGNKVNNIKISPRLASSKEDYKKGLVLIPEDTKMPKITIQMIKPDLISHLSNLSNSQLNIMNYSDIHNNDILITRGNLIDWLLVVSEKIKITDETFFKTIMLFDNYLGKVKNEISDPKELHFIAVVCFFIAFKFEETKVITLEFLETNLLNNKYTRKEISTKEIEILLTLNFKVNFPSVNTFSNTITEIIKTTIKSSIPNGLAGFTEDFLRKFECIYNFVNKISLFVDEFIFDAKAYNISLVNFHATLILLCKLNSIPDNIYDTLYEFESVLATNGGISTKKIDLYASGLYLAIVNQEKNGLHKNLFDGYQKSIEQIIQDEKIKMMFWKI